MEKPFKEIEGITHRILKEGGLEKPSASFVDNVMDAIEAEKTSPITPVRPLISKKGWFAVAIVFVSVLSFIYLFPFGESNYMLDLKISDVRKINPFSEIEISSTLIYGIGFMSFFLVQIPFLKRYFNKFD